MSDLPRDVFINTVLELAQKNEKIIFMSADLGAKSLDRFREELPSQFIHMGISEQNMIDVAAGMAMQGYKVFCYAMAPFITLRCFEQIKVALSCHKLPVTILGVGVGFGYDDAGPTHYSTEDISIMRCIPHMNIYSPSNNKQVQNLAKESIGSDELQYIRLDRKFLKDNEFDKSDNNISIANHNSSINLFTMGYMSHVCNEIIQNSLDEKINIIEINKVHPLPEKIIEVLKSSKANIVVEEHFLNGGLSSSIAELMLDNNILKPLKRFGVSDKYFFENGGRSYIHELCGLDKNSLSRSIESFLSQL